MGETHNLTLVFLCCAVTFRPGGGANKQATLGLSQRVGGVVASLCCTGSIQIYMSRDEDRNCVPPEGYFSTPSYKIIPK